MAGRHVSTLVRDLVIVNLTLVLTIALVSQNASTSDDFGRIAVGYALPMTVFAAILLVWRRISWISTRHFGAYDALNVAFVGVALGVGLRLIEALQPGTVLATDPWVAATLFGLGVSAALLLPRVAMRAARAQAIATSKRKNSRKVLVVGATDSGESLLRALEGQRDPSYNVIGFVDDRVKSVTINGLKVLGGIEDIPALVRLYGVEEVLVALTQERSEDTRPIFRECAKTSARVRVVPSLSDLVVSQRPVMSLVRDVEAEDLLRRPAIEVDQAPVREYVEGRRILITGGGGSIGSELARQVAALGPSALTLVGKGEFSIHEIDSELRHKNIFQPSAKILDVRDRRGISNLFDRERPEVVFHAAAHKHVPLMESAPIEAIGNNVFGTLNMVENALSHGVHKFILVSTDKAAKPVNVMGATKRVAELIVAAMATRADTDFAVVRFGNVLGSRGSFVPILKRQIAEGGPVTITHPDMTRYFMTIPEAVKLIVQAGALGRNGEVHILDMGQPVSIVELAKDMIRLHGLVPGQDIELKYTGIRPGEKIHEILAGEGERLEASSHPKISVVHNQGRVGWPWLAERLSELRRLCDLGDEESARRLLMEIAWEREAPASIVDQQAATSVS